LNFQLLIQGHFNRPRSCVSHVTKSPPRQMPLTAPISPSLGSLGQYGG